MRLSDWNRNQVTVGKRDASMMNFKVNIFSIGLGMAFYL